MDSVEVHPDLVDKPDILLIDADILTYEIPFAAEYVDDEGNKQVRDFDFVVESVERFIEYLCLRLNCNSFKLFLTGDGNFREEIAVSKKYKGERKAKPFHHTATRHHLVMNYDALVVDGMEADDMLGIVQCEMMNLGMVSVICSRDKDLKQITGYHYTWPVGFQKESLIYATELGELTLAEGKKKKLTGCGMKWFYAQLIMGDRVDNIPGLPKMGDVAAHLALKDCTDEREMWSKVREMYHAKGYDDAYLMEQAHLLWMCRDLHEDGTPVLFTPPIELED